MGKRIKCPKGDAETLKNIQRLDRPGNFFTVVREYKCLKCGHTWWVDKSLAELRRDKYIAEHCGSGRYPHPDLLNRLELAHAKELALWEERNRKLAIEKKKHHWKIEIEEAKKTKDRSKLLFYLPDSPQVKH